jgi:hypothetical protein
MNLRARSGLANARAKGKVLGRPPLRRLSAHGDCCTEAGTCPGETTVQNTGPKIRRFGVDRSPALRDWMLGESNFTESNLSNYTSCSCCDNFPFARHSGAIPRD